jgi:hypothetical protein
LSTCKERKRKNKPLTEFHAKMIDSMKESTMQTKQKQKQKKPKKPV